MSLLDAILGRTEQRRSNDDSLIALSTAAVTLQAELGLTPSGQAGIVIRPVESEAYRQAEAGLGRLLEIAGRETGATITESNDAYGYRWVVVTDDSLADLVSNAYAVSTELRDAGFGDGVLAAAFGFRDPSGRPVFWLYNFKRSTFYPFAPSPDGARRDTARELQLAASVDRELPVERDETRWYPMWGMPLAGAPTDRAARTAAAGGGDQPSPDTHDEADDHDRRDHPANAGHAGGHRADHGC